jgi:hypothetical protein
MTTVLPSLSRTSPLARSLALVSLAAGAWALTAGMSQAHARDVFWSVGVNGPGVTIGASNAPVVVHQPPSYYYPPPVVVHQPPPVYYRPRPVYVQPEPVYYYPQPVVVGPRPVVVQSGYGYPPRWRDHPGRGHGRWDHRDDDRHDDHRRGHRDRDDDRRGDGRR